MRPDPLRLALALSGGGARAAYQVGFLRFLATQFPHFAPDILTGTSAGAVNAAYLAAALSTRGRSERCLAASSVLKTAP